MSSNYFSAVLNFLCVPLDFFAKNSYYLSVGSNSLSFSFVLRQARSLLRSQNMLYIYEEFKIKLDECDVIIDIRCIPLAEAVRANVCIAKVSAPVGVMSPVSLNRTIPRTNTGKRTKFRKNRHIITRIYK